MAILGTFLVLIGVAAWRIGRYGYASGYHPFCQACGFDLFALPLETRRCPECGADILADNAVHIGQRHPIRTAIGLGIASAVTGALLLAFAFIAWWPHFDGSPYKPLAWLEADLNAPQNLTRARACSEIQARLAGGRLSQADVDQLADILLKYQSTPAIAWYPAWGDLIQAAEAGEPGKRLSTVFWQRYISQAMGVSAQVRPRIRIDDPVPIAVMCQLRVGTDFTAMNHLMFTPDVVVTLDASSSPIATHQEDLATHPVPLAWHMIWMPPPVGGHPSAPAWPAAITPGPHILHVAVTLTVTDAAGARVVRSAAFPLPVTILPASESSVVLRHETTPSDVPPSPLPPSPTAAPLAQQIAASIHFSGAPRAPAATMRSSPPPTENLLFERGGTLGSLWVSAPPVCTAFRVVLRQNGREWGLARFMVRPDDAATVPLTLGNLSFFERPSHDAPAQIVCIPEPAMATGTVDVLEVWGEPVTFPIELVMSH